MVDYREIKLPAELCAGVEQKFAQRFASLEQLLEFVLTQLADQKAVDLDAAEQRVVEERLRELGYL
jgi:hypothetical protein